MSLSSVAKRRTCAAVGSIAAITLLGAGPAMSALSQQTEGQAGAQLTDSAVKVVPSNVALFKVNTSLLGVHNWYRQMQDGYPVVGGLYARHLETRGPAKGQVNVWDGRVTTGPLPSTKATVTAQAATKAAVAATKGTPLSFVKPKLWVLPGPVSHLVWGVTTVTSRHGYGASHVSYVDASSGKVLKSVVESRNDRAPGHVQPARFVAGKARVFDPNPVVKLQNEDLTDQHDSDSAVPKAGYSTRLLGHLDAGENSLIGKWAQVVNPKHRATSQNFTYAYLRANNRFEQVMGYYALDTEESYYQSLGFTDVNAESQKISTDSIPDDNSFYSPSQDLIVTGTGGVDDAEDPEVVWHEDGHATQDAQVPHFGKSEQAGAIGEGFGDWIAVTMGQIHSKSTDLTPTSCVMDWDSTSYTSGPKHCLRTTVTDKMYPDDLDGEVHDDGEIWSHALYNLSLSLGHDRAVTTVLEAQFSFNPKINMPHAAAIVVDTAGKLYGPHAAKQATAAFHDRGIL
jgi:Zn-dependent metalloprotease